MLIFVCDRCGKQSEQRDSGSYGAPKEWRELSFQIQSYSHKKVFLCPVCCKALGIEDKEDRDTVAESLIEILNEIAQNAVSDI